MGCSEDEKKIGETMPCRCCGASRPSKGFNEPGEEDIYRLLKVATTLILEKRCGYDCIEEWKEGWQEAFDHMLNGCQENKLK